MLYGLWICYIEFQGVLHIILIDLDSSQFILLYVFILLLFFKVFLLAIN